MCNYGVTREVGTIEGEDYVRCGECNSLLSHEDARDGVCIACDSTLRFERPDADDGGETEDEEDERMSWLDAKGDQMDADRDEMEAAE